MGAFDGGAITSDGGALLLGATDKAIGLIARFAACFSDARAPELIEHSLETLVGQRVFGFPLRRSASASGSDRRRPFSA